MIEIRTSTDTHGPLLDGRAAAAVNAFTDDAEKEIGQRGENMVRTRLHQVLQHPTGYYESQIQTDRQMNDVAINDDRVIYGPWLEGVGSRNRTTRFKGYATFRRVTQQLDAAAAPIAESILPNYLRRMQ